MKFQAEKSDLKISSQFKVCRLSVYWGGARGRNTAAHVQARKLLFVYASAEQFSLDWIGAIFPSGIQVFLYIYGSVMFI